jgi:hypothetical protein
MGTVGGLAGMTTAGVDESGALHRRAGSVLHFRFAFRLDFALFTVAYPTRFASDADMPRAFSESAMCDT